MNTHTSRTNIEHHQLSLLLPWYVNQSLVPEERQQVETHLQGCSECHQQLMFLQHLADAVVNNQDFPELEVNADASFSDLRKKLQANSASRENSTVVAFKMPGSTQAGTTKEHRVITTHLLHGVARYYVPIAIAASLVLTLIPVTLHFVGSSESASFYTLSSAKPEMISERMIRVVFAKSLADSDINTLLEHIHGQRIAGPNSVGAYTIRLDADDEGLDIAVVLAQLRQQGGVMLAEPVQHP